MKIQVIVRPTEQEVRRLTTRRAVSDPGVEATAGRILEAVRQRGDAAVAEYTRRYDGCRPRSLQVPEAEIHAAGAALSGELKTAIDTARRNIRRFHDYYCEEGDFRIHTFPGVECFQRQVAIDRVGLYVPGGRHPLFSSLLMLGIPAALAGCRQVVVCTPPGRSGHVHPAILYCAGLLGIQQVFRVGGAQAVAAMAYGTESISAVDKIFGPGNDYVTEAKMQVAREGVAVDMPAGPSELMVVADHSARAQFIAADLLGQLEHGGGSRALLVSLDGELALAVRKELVARVDAGQLSPTIEENLKHTVLMVVDDRERALRILNDYAPEHLSLAVSDPEVWVENVRHAGSVFLGHWAAEAVGDYAAGTNHTLPTGGHARAWSGITVRSFQKSISFQSLTPAGLLEVAKTVEVMAAVEELPLHAASVALRRRAAESMPREDVDPLEMLSRRVRRLRPYTCAREKSHCGETVLLDANEMPVSFPGARGMNRYPDPRQQGLTRRIAEIYGWEPERILLGNGSDELIDILVRGFCDSGRDRILVTPPAYGMYAVCARSNGVEVLEVPLGQRFALDADQVVNRAREGNVRIIFLTSPNNPTGNLLEKEAVLEVVRNSGAAVVVDEAYIDFAADPGLAHRVAEFSNLFVVRTFSKSWGAAGVRVGLLLGNAAVLAALRGLQAPYNISTPNQEVLARILDRREEQEFMARQLVMEREKLVASLAELNCVVRIHPSRANFLLVVFRHARKVMKYLEGCGVRVRDRSDLSGCVDCLRISVGTAGENRRLLKCLRQFNGGEA